MRYLKHLAAGLLAAAFSFVSADAVTYTVNPSTGTDAASCRGAAPTTKCRTVQYLINNENLGNGAGVASDGVVLEAGTYYEEIDLGGSSGADDQGEDIAGTPNYTEFNGASASQVMITGLSSTALDDSTFVQCSAEADCDGNSLVDLAYPNVYRAPRAGTIRGVYELNYYPGKIRLDDRPLQSGGWNHQGPNSGTDAIYDLTYDPGYTRFNDGLGTLPLYLTYIQRLAGSFYNTGGFLYVHTWDGDNPATANLNLEVREREYCWINPDRDYLKLYGITFAYCGRGFHNNPASDHLYFEGMLFHSNGAGLSCAGCSNTTVFQVSFYTHHDRGDYNDTPLDTAVPRDFNKHEGWYENAAAGAFSLDGDSVGVTGNEVVQVTARQAWNVAQFKANSNLIVRDSLFADSPNHLLTFSPSGTNEVTCLDNFFYRNVFLNGQEVGPYIGSCSNTRLSRNVAIVSGGLDQQSVWDTNPPNTRYCGNISLRAKPGAPAAQVSTAASVGFHSDYNWYESGPYCDWGGLGASNYRACGATAAPDDWNDVSGQDANSATATTALNGITIPFFANGLTASTLTKTSFCAITTSTTILDVGDPDLDCDGVLETGVGGDDECISANKCYNGVPDIGPCEHGIDIPAGTGGTPTQLIPRKASDGGTFGRK